ncbi:MAG: YedE-related selenium metabolism membrane protein [bacterium]|nr:YedE-related selenium metabolism membrane protein [bacterium]
MSFLKRLFSGVWGVIITGVIVGILAPLLVKLGNPGNMGVCVACFTRDIAGALGLHNAGVVQYIRPEIIGFVLGALVAALIFKEFKPRTGSAPIIRFFLGMFAMIGTLMFLGCPWRAYLRLAGGDWNAIAGIIGLAVGIGIGVVFIKFGFGLGRSRPAPKFVGWIVPILMLILLALAIFVPQFTVDADGNAAGPIFSSVKGPGAMAAPLLISLGVGLLVGFLAQRSRFCTVGAFRDLILMRDMHLMWGVIALVVAAFVTNFILGQFNPGFEGQPVAHTNTLWNFGGMVLAGLAFTLAGGCPGRQVFLSGEGDADAGTFLLGMMGGAAVSHIFAAASSPAGPGHSGPIFVIIGLVFCVAVGLLSRERVMV